MLDSTLYHHHHHHHRNKKNEEISFGRMVSIPPFLPRLMMAQALIGPQAEFDLGGSHNLAAANTIVYSRCLIIRTHLWNRILFLLQKYISSNKLLFFN